MDDDAYFREVIRGVIAATPGFECVADAVSGEDAIRAAASLHPDLVLMDVRMTGIDGFEAALRMRESDPGLPVGLISADPIEPPPGFRPPGSSVVLIPKGELCPRRLLELWHGFGTRQAQMVICENACPRTGTRHRVRRGRPVGLGDFRDTEPGSS